MDYNHDLTMESDFIGQFNPVRGLRNKNNSSLTDEQLEALQKLQNIDDRLPSDCYISEADLLRFRGNLNAEPFQNIEYEYEEERYYFTKLKESLSEKYAKIGIPHSIVIDVRYFSEKNIQVNFYSRRAKDTNIRIRALGVLRCLAFFDSLRTGSDGYIPEEAYNQQNYDTAIQLIRNSYVYLLNVVEPCTGIDLQNRSYTTGTVSFDKSVIVKGDNILTGSYSSETDEFSIYINNKLFTKLQNMSHWGYKIELNNFDYINYVTYPDFDDISNENPTLNISEFGGKRFCDPLGSSTGYTQAELCWECGTPNTFVEFLLGDSYSNFPYMLDYSSLTSNNNYIYFCEYDGHRFGLATGVDVLGAIRIQDESLWKNVLHKLYNILDDIKYAINGDDDDDV